MTTTILSCPPQRLSLSSITTPHAGPPVAGSPRIDHIMEQTLRFLQEDREAKAERAANIAAVYSSVGSSSTRSQERLSQGGHSRESRRERDAEARAEAEERKRNRVEVGVPVDEDGWLKLVDSCVAPQRAREPMTDLLRFANDAVTPREDLSANSFPFV